jgi:flagellar motor switch protein FliM
MRVEGRPFTSIERTLVERLIRLVLAEMSTAFEPLSLVEFRYERLETNPRFAAIVRPTNAAVLCRLRVHMDDRGGLLEVLIPYATLEPVRDLLLQMFMGEKFGRDSIWETHLARQMQVTGVEIEALLEEQTISLGEAMALTVGTTLPLNIRPNTAVILRCGQVPLLRGRVGRVGDHIAVRIEDKLDGEERRR